MKSLLTAPGRPRLTWYGDDGERIELSGAVLVNWISKTTNLLIEEFDAGPGCRILIDVPAHWRHAVWALAGWRTGATVVLPGRDGPAADGAAVDLTVTTRPHLHHGQVVAVALPALARRFDGTLPPGAIDAAGAVMTYADEITWAPPTDPAQPALVSPGDAGAPDEAVVVGHDGLLDWAAHRAPAPGARILVDGREPVADVLAVLLGTWAAGGSVVLTSCATTAALDTDPSRRERITTQEGVTA